MQGDTFNECGVPEQIAEALPLGEGVTINLSVTPSLTVGLPHLKICYAEKDVPQPQPPVAFGFSKVKPEPIMFEA